MFNVNLDPLIQQIRLFTQAQEKTNLLLTEILQEIRSNKNTSIVEDKLKK